MVGSNGADDVVARLAGLAELRASGALTEDEFAAAKAQVLGGGVDRGSEREGAGATDAPSMPPAVAEVPVRPQAARAVSPTARAPWRGTVEDRMYRELVAHGDGVSSAALAARLGVAEGDVAIALDDLLACGVVWCDRSSGLLWVPTGAPQPGTGGVSPQAQAARTASRSQSGPVADRGRSDPHLGGWGWAVVLLGVLGGAIGYFSVCDEDPRRANHIMKWGLIWTVLWWPLSYLIVLLLFSAV